MNLADPTFSVWMKSVEILSLPAYPTRYGFIHGRFWTVIQPTHVYSFPSLQPFGMYVAFQQTAPCRLQSKRCNLPQPQNAPAAFHWLHIVGNALSNQNINLKVPCQAALYGTSGEETTHVSSRLTWDVDKSYFILLGGVLHIIQEIPFGELPQVSY